MARLHTVRMGIPAGQVPLAVTPLTMTLLGLAVAAYLLALTALAVVSRLPGATATVSSSLPAVVQPSTARVPVDWSTVQEPDCATASFLTGDIVGNGNPVEMYAAVCGATHGRR